MSDEGLAALREIRDLLIERKAIDAAQDEEIAALYERQAALEAKSGRQGVRLGKVEARLKGLAYEHSLLATRLLILEGRR